MNSRNCRAKSCRRSFTLMEMVVVIAILALLVTIVTPMYFRHLKKAKTSTAKTQVRLLEQAVMDFKLDTGKFPSSLEDLIKNISGEKKWDGPYMKNIPKDPWSNSYIYTCPGQHGEFDIMSYGNDGAPGGDGENADIGTWADETPEN